ncbi:MAG: hypothetical protein OES34_11315 [Nitrosopumilus sp.]|nr:hypothetical protein [Nitrosopumilus sp.]
MGKYSNFITTTQVKITDPTAQLGLINQKIANELAEANRIALLNVKLRIAQLDWVVLDKETKKAIDLRITAKDLEDQA